MKLEELKSRDNIGHVLSSMMLYGAGAEIGVERGLNAEQILKTSYLSYLYLVDPWKYVTESNPIGFGIGYENWNEIYEECILRMEQFADRFRVMQMTSRQAASKIPDDSLDFVYIDANHMSPYIDNDLLMWFPKLRSGGVMGGHDYYDKTIDGVFQCDVKRVVDQFFSEKQITPHITEDEVPSWYIEKAA